MRYYKKTKGDSLLLIGIGEGGCEITREEYRALLEEIRKIPFSVQDMPCEEARDYGA